METHALKTIPETIVPTKTARDWRFDLIRVFACFGVVVAHTTGSFQFAPERTVIGVLGVVAYCLGRTSLTLFFLTAGYFALTRIKTANDVPDFWRRRLKRVWLPTLFWSACYLGLYLADRFASGRSVDAARVLHDWLWLGKPGAGYHLWFLYVLFALELVAPWVMLAQRKKPREYNAALFTLWLAFGTYSIVSIAVFGDDGRGSFFGVLAFGYLPWYCWGALSGARARLLPTLARQIGNGALFAAGVGLGSMVATTYLVGHMYARCDFLPPCLLLTFGLWSYAITRRDAAPPKFERALQYLAELSFGVYVLHIAVLTLVSRVAPALSKTVPGALVLSVVTFLCSVILAAVIKRIPFLRRTI